MTEQNQGQTFGPESDPADFTVEQVNAYLKDADETERQRVLDAEANGKDRATVAAPTADEKPAVETTAATFAEAAEQVPATVGQAYDQGYFGHAPSRDGDKPVDLTLAGVTGQADKDA